MKIFFIAQCVFASLSVFYGYGTEANFVDYDLIENALLVSIPFLTLLLNTNPSHQFFYILQILYKATINCVKISILALYIRVFTPTWIRWVSMVLFIAAHLATLALVFVTMFQCVPVKCTYTPWDKPANSVSIDVAAFWKANALWNIGSDVLIIALPVSLIRGIRNLTVGQRINMLLMFGLGLVVLVAAILRFTTLGTAYNGHDDILTSSYVSTIWTQVESALAVSCACLPMLRPFLAWCLTPPGNVQSAATGGWVNMEEEVNSGLPRGAVMQPVPVERIGRAL